LTKIYNRFKYAYLQFLRGADEKKISDQHSQDDKSFSSSPSDPVHQIKWQPPNIPMIFFKFGSGGDFFQPYIPQAFFISVFSCFPPSSAQIPPGIVYGR